MKRINNKSKKGAASSPVKEQAVEKVEEKEEKEAAL